MYELGEKEFLYISRKVYDYARINLTEKKKPLIVSRLSKRIRQLGLGGFPEYVRYLESSPGAGEEFQRLVDAVSTNYSLFFREPHHFKFLTDEILPHADSRGLNIWSAASSTGQEVYSILITILEFQRKTGRKFPCSLFASDISSEVLKTASQGIFQRKDAAGMDQEILKRYFLSGSGTMKDCVKVRNEYVKKIRFFRLNLSDKSYALPPMDAVFLRNVIIYFDKETKTELINRLYRYLKPGGYLFLGHSESLSGISDLFELKGKTVYRRIEQ